jgi:hypothetical protein
VLELCARVMRENFDYKVLTIVVFFFFFFVLYFGFFFCFFFFGFSSRHVLDVQMKD